LSAALRKVCQEFLEWNAFFRCLDPTFWLELLWLGVEFFIGVDEVGRLAQGRLFSNSNDQHLESQPKKKKKSRETG
jgi:hypothetical protein